MTFQERLITLRKQQGLSQEQLGYELGVTRQTVSKWELGVTTPEMDKLIQLSDFFHISIDELVGRGTPEPASEEAETEQAQTAREIHYVPYHWHYEYKSRRTLFGLPLVHINIGRWIPGQKLHRARGSACRWNCCIRDICSRRICLPGFSLSEYSQPAFCLSAQ